MHEMAARADPGLVAQLEPEAGDALDRHQTAIGDAAGKARFLLAEQRGAHRRLDAVGTDQHIGCNCGAVVEMRLAAVAAVGRTDQPMPEVDALRRKCRGNDVQ